MNMMITAKSHSQATNGIPWIEKLLGQQLFKAIGPAPVRFVLKDGTAISPIGSMPVGTVFIHDNRTLAKLSIDPEMAFGEAYAEGRVHVNGDLVRLLEAVYQSMGAAPGKRYERLTSKWMNWWQADTLHGSRSNIHRHYDLGNDFYKLWLDPQMIYTCAYFVSPQATLEEAQEAKLDYICRKLQLRLGETVVEAGCGWGALALFMAQHYGVSVKAFNISHEQILFARRAAAERGLSGQVEFIEDDYRNVPSGFDAFVSVGMLEHVDPKRFADFGEVIYRAVGDTGRGLLHFIGRSHQMYGAWFQRAWRLYLAGSIAGFRAGTLQLFQITFGGSKRQSSSWTRAPLYSETGY